MASTVPSLDSIFCTAIGLESAQDRAAYIAESCGSDAELRRQVEKLVAAHFQAGSFLDRPASNLEATGEFTPTPEDARRETVVIAEGPGSVIGPYKLLEQIGEGGMGLVFVAEQQRPVKRRVALKIIKPGMDSRQVIARFEAERQALAMMDHPNIAKVLDGGTVGPQPDAQARAAETLAGAAGCGRPFFVMEFVKGTPITEYCDNHRLTTRNRLQLFMDVCHAVQHAHQKGIIHRDIKPSNVLVEIHDVKPVVKVIDFGIAKATGQQLTEKTLYTGVAQMVGTPLYMSPEPAGLSSLDVDTRSDVYSLGVLLYELLTGTTPFESETLKKAGYDEMRRIIREDEPPRPSARLSTMQQAHLSTIAEQRGLEPHRLSRKVRGELDWIVMKALEKDRNRRYESASTLAADVHRYLDDLPILASPPSAAYRLRKALRRHRAATLAVSLVGLALLGGTFGTSWGLLRANEAWKAESQRADSEQHAKEEAQAREAETQAVLDFVEKRVFIAARLEGDGGLGHDVTLRRAVEAALPFVAQSFPDQPLIEARVRKDLGDSFHSLGDYQKAAEQYEKASALYGQHIGPDHRITLWSTNLLANSYERLGRKAETLMLREENLALSKAKFGAEDILTIQFMGNLAASYADLDRWADALKLLEEALALSRATLGPDHPDTLKTMGNLAACYEGLGRFEDGVKLLEELMPLCKVKLGPDNLHTLGTVFNLAVLYSHVARHDEALKLYEEALASGQAKLGPNHWWTLESMCGLATELSTCPDVKLRDPKRAVELARKAVERGSKLGIRTGTYQRALGIAHYRCADLQASIAALGESMKLQDGGDSRDWFFLAMAHWKLGDKEQARRWYDKAVAWMEKNQPQYTEFRRYRAEAAELLGITEAAGPKTKENEPKIVPPSREVPDK
jgi:non-specific serine/threonine protein kinase/serine/threonine-protein kinase